MQHDVFISYTQPDRNVAIYLHDLFQANNIVSWMALSKIKGIATGVTYESQIVHAISASKVFVLVYSVYCNESGDIIQEIRHRNKNHKTIIVRLDNSAFGSDLSYHLKGIQYIDAPRDSLHTITAWLLKDISKALNIDRHASVVSTDRLLFLNGMKLIRQNKYAEAAGIFQQHLQIEPDNNETRFYLSLAMISRKKTRKLDGLLVRRLENILLPAILSATNAGYAGLLLAIIKQGYYAGNGLKIPAPDIKQLLTGITVNTEKANDILAHLYEPENSVWQDVSRSYINHR